MTGRKQDILIEEKRYTDNRTGVETVSDRSFAVWADEGMLEVIKSVEGVTAAYVGQPFSTKYEVFTDPRYDIEFIKREVEAAILCKE